MTLPPVPAPWSYHLLSSLDTLKEAWASGRNGLGNQASFPVDLDGKCPSFASAFSMGKARALSHVSLLVLFLFISRIVLGEFLMFLMRTIGRPLVYWVFAASFPSSVSSFLCFYFFSLIVLCFDVQMMIER